MSGVSNPTDISPLVEATKALNEATRRIEILTRVLIGIAAVQTIIAVAALIVASQHVERGVSVHTVLAGACVGWAGSSG